MGLVAKGVHRTVESSAFYLTMIGSYVVDRHPFRTAARDIICGSLLNGTGIADLLTLSDDTRTGSMSNHTEHRMATRLRISAFIMGRSSIQDGGDSKVAVDIEEIEYLQMEIE